jgi:Tfp pilus assembly protein PilN
MKRTLNLMPPVEVRPVAKKNLIAAIVVGVTAYAVVLGGVWFLSTFELTRLNSTIEDLSNRKHQMQQYMAVTAGPGGVPAGADPVIMSMMRTTPPWDAVLAELSLVMPGGVWLELVESPDAKHLRLKGYAKSQSGIVKLIEGLERSRYFGNVEIVFAQKGERALTFELKTEMKWT